VAAVGDGQTAETMYRLLRDDQSDLMEFHRRQCCTTARMPGLSRLTVQWSRHQRGLLRRDEGHDAGDAPGSY
jgi:hypothetical protein